MFYALDNTKLLLVPKSISIFDLVSENFHRKNELRCAQESTNQENQVATVGRILRTEIMECKPEFSWPPKLSELNGENIHVPPLTKLFYRSVINGRDFQSDRCDWKVNRFIKTFLLL